MLENDMKPLPEGFKAEKEEGRKEKVKQLAEDFSPEYTLANCIMQDFQVKRYGTIKLKTWFWYKDKFISDDIKLKRLVWDYCEGKRTRFVDEVVKQLNERAELIKPFQVFPIKFKNGRLEKGIFIHGEYKEFTPFSIELNYSYKATHVTAVDDYLNQLTGYEKEYRELFLEMIGSCLITDFGMISSLARFFILVGDGGNGKGTGLSVIRSILGRQNVSSLSITQMTKEQYFPSMLDVMANLGDELEDKPISDDTMKVVKNVSTGDWIPARELYAMSTDVRAVCTMIFTSNHVLKSFEKGKSFKRRVLWLPIYTEVKKPDPNFLDKITNEKALEYWLKLAVEGVLRLYENSKYTESSKVSEWNEQYHRDNDNTIDYVETLKREALIGLVGKDVYQGYCQWAEENGLNALVIQAFYKTIREIHKLDVKQVRDGQNRNRIFIEA